MTDDLQAQMKKLYRYVRQVPFALLGVIVLILFCANPTWLGDKSYADVLIEIAALYGTMLILAITLSLPSIQTLSDSLSPQFTSWYLKRGLGLKVITWFSLLCLSTFVLSRYESPWTLGIALLALCVSLDVARYFYLQSGNLYNPESALRERLKPLIRHLLGRSKDRMVKATNPTELRDQKETRELLLDIFRRAYLKKDRLLALQSLSQIRRLHRAYRIAYRHSGFASRDGLLTTNNLNPWLEPYFSGIRTLIQRATPDSRDAILPELLDSMLQIHLDSALTLVTNDEHGETTLLWTMRKVRDTIGDELRLRKELKTSDTRKLIDFLWRAVRYNRMYSKQYPIRLYSEWLDLFDWIGQFELSQKEDGRAMMQVGILSANYIYKARQFISDERASNKLVFQNHFRYLAGVLPLYDFRKNISLMNQGGQGGIHNHFIELTRESNHGGTMPYATADRLVARYVALHHTMFVELSALSGDARFGESGLFTEFIKVFDLPTKEAYRTLFVCNYIAPSSFQPFMVMIDEQLAIITNGHQSDPSSEDLLELYLYLCWLVAVAARHLSDRRSVLMIHLLDEIVTRLPFGALEASQQWRLYMRLLHVELAVKVVVSPMVAGALEHHIALMHTYHESTNVRPSSLVLKLEAIKIAEGFGASQNANDFSLVVHDLLPSRRTELTAIIEGLMTVVIWGDNE